MRKYGVNISPVSGKVYVGKINKAGNLFLEKEEIDKWEALAIAVGIIKNYLEAGKTVLEITSDTETITCEVKKNA